MKQDEGTGNPYANIGEDDDRERVFVTRNSPFSGEVHTLEIPCSPTAYRDYMAGKTGMIQEALPNVPAELREFILTGITPEEWDKYIGSDDEPEEEIVETNTNGDELHHLDDPMPREGES